MMMLMLNTLFCVAFYVKKQNDNILIHSFTCNNQYEEIHCYIHKRFRVIQYSSFVKPKYELFTESDKNSNISY